MDGLADVGRADVRCPGQIGNGPGDLEDAVVGPGGIVTASPKSSAAIEGQAVCDVNAVSIQDFLTELHAQGISDIIEANA